MQKLATIGTWNGILEGCLGKDCPTPCCNVKKVIGTDEQEHDYITMVNEKEKEKIIQAGVPVTFEAFEQLTGYDMKTYAPQGELIIALTGGCLGATGCSIPDVKPSACKSYPYQINIDNYAGLPEPPFDMHCPSVVHIVSNEENTKKILETRKSARYPDNKKYIDALIFALSIMGTPDPKWKFLEDPVYMEAIL